jgi:hypothetical protein
MLTGGPDTLDDPFPAFVGRRQRHLDGTVRALVDPGAATEAGLAIVLDESAHAEVAITGGRVVARARSGEFRLELGDAPAPDGPVVLRVATAPDPRGPDRITLGYEDDAGFHPLGDLDGRHLSTEVTGGFIGRVIGVYAVGGEAAVDWFEDEAAG